MTNRNRSSPCSSNRYCCTESAKWFHVNFFQASRSHLFNPSTIAPPSKGPPVRNQSHILCIVSHIPGCDRDECSLHVSASLGWLRIAQGNSTLRGPEESGSDIFSTMPHNNSSCTYDNPQATDPTRTNQTFP